MPRLIQTLAEQRLREALHSLLERIGAVSPGVECGDDDLITVASHVRETEATFFAINPKLDEDIPF